MKTETGIRELKAKLSDYLRRVEAGETVTITRRGKPIGRIVPVSQSTDTKLQMLHKAGLIDWSGERLPPLAPVAQLRGQRTVADLLVEDRE